MDSRIYSRRAGWGDFQTPLTLAESVLRSLPQREWGRVLEPTCGIGTFLEAAKVLGGAERVGIEVQGGYLERARATGARVLHASIFDLHAGKDVPWTSQGPLLVVGNPPWVTNAELGLNGSSNLPPKSNLHGLRGIDALTGSSNFDIAEFIWLKLITELGPLRPVIALLCKTQVARNVLAFCSRRGIRLGDCSIRSIDAKRWFGASVDACLFTVAVGGQSNGTCPIYPSLEADEPNGILAVIDGHLMLDASTLGPSAGIDGACQLQWRQGVKHDAAGVMELNVDPDGKQTNKFGEVVEVEPDALYPLLKATDLHRARLDANRRVIVTQRALTDDTVELARRAPRLWAYLLGHAAQLDARRSSIYRGRPRFAMFGVGDYTFAPWKVAVSGLHRDPAFRVVGCCDGKPTILDDTCYFLPFECCAWAVLVAALLRSDPVRRLLSAIVFPEAKRPITKRVLQRIDLMAAAELIPRKTVFATARDLIPLSLESPSESDLDRLLNSLNGGLRVRSPKA
jgi:hypothetical protein